MCKDRQKIKDRAYLFCGCALLLFLALFIPYTLGAFTKIDNSRLPDGACSEKGRIETLTYQTGDGSDSVEKKALVYLPCGYSEEEEAYEVLYFYHGSLDDETTAFSYQNIVNLLDNLIAMGEICPVIVVTPTWKMPEGGSAVSGRSYERVASELRNDLIPAVDEAYRTVSERSGRAIAGVSYGSMYSLQSGLLRNYDLFDTYGSFSGAWTDAFSLAKVLDEGAEKGEELRLLYASNGTKDFTLIDHTAVMAMLDLLSDEAENGKNFRFALVSEGEHDWELWEASLSGFLREAYGGQ